VRQRARFRVELAGQISQTRAALRQLIIDLDHIDAAIRLVDPAYDVTGIRQNIPSAAHRAIRGDLTRATLDAPGPMTTKELARHVMAERGLNTADAAFLQLFTPSNRRVAPLAEEARHPAKRQRSEHGQFDLWEIAI